MMLVRASCNSGTTLFLVLWDEFGWSLANFSNVESWDIFFVASVYQMCCDERPRALSMLRKQDVDTTNKQAKPEIDHGRCARVFQEAFLD